MTAGDLELRRMHEQNRPQTLRAQVSGQAGDRVSGQQQITQAMQAEDGSLPPWGLSTAGQQNDRVETQ